jgi:hypothetical protein
LPKAAGSASARKPGARPTLRDRTDPAAREPQEHRLVAKYVLLTSLFAGALFGLALAVLFSQKTGSTAK